MSKTFSCLPADSSDLTLSHDVAGNDVGQASTFHVFHDDPQIATVKEGIDKVDDVGMPRRLHDQDLIDDEILLGLLLEIHLFDGDRDVTSG